MYLCIPSSMFPVLMNVIGKNIAHNILHVPVHTLFN